MFERVEWSMNEWRAGIAARAAQRRGGPRMGRRSRATCARCSRSRRTARARTGGRFDPTWAALSDLWRFDGSAPAPPPDAAVRGAVRARRSPAAPAAPPRPARCEARLAARRHAGRPGRAREGLGARRRGPRAARARRHATSSSRRAAISTRPGRAAAAPWRVASAIRAAVRSTSCRVRWTSATAPSRRAGDYEHAYVAGGRRYHHLIDPRTCRPADGEPLGDGPRQALRRRGDPRQGALRPRRRAGAREAERWGAEALIVDADGAVLATAGLRVVAARSRER